MHTLYQQLVEYIELLWQEGEPKWLAAQTICGLQHFLRIRKCFPASWKFFGTWDREEPSVGVPPIAVNTLFALCGACLRRRDWDTCFAILVGFHCMLRTSEIDYMEYSHFEFRKHLCVLHLPWSKSGVRFGQVEQVVVECPLCLKLLRRLSAVRSGRVFRGSQTTLRGQWARICHDIGVDPRIHTPYALRRGGATWDFTQSGSLSRSCVRGMWRQQSTARIYIRQALQILQQVRTTDVQNDRILCFANEFKQVVNRLVDS